MDQGFTEFELRQYNGEGRRMYIAFEGHVYDVNDCPNWKDGLHQGLHFPGQDLSQEIIEAPHGKEMFSHPCVKRVGYIRYQD